MANQVYKFPFLGMYTNSHTPISIMDDFGNLVLQTVSSWNYVYSVFLGGTINHVWQ